MALHETPTGVIQTGGTKSFLQIQTEQEEARQAGEVVETPCGVETPVLSLKKTATTTPKTSSTSVTPLTGENNG